MSDPWLPGSKPGRGHETMNEDLSPESVRQQFQKTIDWMKSIAADKMKTVEGCRWLEENWDIRVEYPPGTPEDQKFRKAT